MNIVALLLVSCLLNYSCPFTLQAVKLKVDLEKEHVSGMQVLNKMNTCVRQLEAQVHEFQLKRMQQTQVNLFFLNAIFYLKSKYLIQFASSPHDWL